MKPISSLILLVKGVVFGVANIIPGVSGGTMAVVMGIYDRLIEAISGFVTDKGKRISHLIFLIILGIGAVIGIKGLAPVIAHSLDHYPELTMLFFMGLISGSMPTVIKLAGVKKIGMLDMLAIAIGMAVVFALGGSSDAKEGITAAANNVDLLVLFGAAILAGGAMIVPGVSGSLVMVLVGAYPVVLYAIDKMDFKLLAVIGAGCGLGVLLFSIIIRTLLKVAANMTHCFIFGLVGASVVVLFQGLPAGNLGWLTGGLAFAIGALLSHASALASPKSA
jgi:putative membrane protein